MIRIKSIANTFAVILVSSIAVMFLGCGKNSEIGSNRNRKTIVASSAEQRNIVYDVWNNAAIGDNAIRAEEVWEKHLGKTFVVTGTFRSLHLLEEGDESVFYLYIEPEIDMRISLGGAFSVEVPVWWISLFPERSRKDLAKLKNGEAIKVQGQFVNILKVEGELHARAVLGNAKILSE